jgi:hypothetical protein
MFDITNIDVDINWQEGSRAGEFFSDFITKNNKEYRVYIESDPTNIKKFMFIVNDGSVPPDDLNDMVLNHPNELVWNIVFEEKGNEASYGVTGSGESVEVFSNVFARLKDFADKFNPKFARIMAIEPSRVKLYDKMVSTLAHTINYKYFTFIYENDKKMYLFYR